MECNITYIHAFGYKYEYKLYLSECLTDIILSSPSPLNAVLGMCLCAGGVIKDMWLLQLSLADSETCTYINTKAHNKPNGLLC